MMIGKNMPTANEGGFLDIPPVCRHFRGIDYETEEVQCSKGHRYTTDDDRCLERKCPDYEPKPSQDTNLIAADVLNLLQRERKIMVPDEIIPKVQSLEDSRRAEN